jgi:hypothetical protein
MTPAISSGGAILVLIVARSQARCLATTAIDSSAPTPSAMLRFPMNSKK